MLWHPMDGFRYLLGRRGNIKNNGEHNYSSWGMCDTVLYSVDLATLYIAVASLLVIYEHWLCMMGRRNGALLAVWYDQDP